MPAPRRFPLPWTAEETAACYIVEDATGCARLNLLTRDEARRIASNIVKLPELRQGGAAS